MIVLGIETSCDESAAALLHYHESGWKILAEEISSSQTDIHKFYGGVVPELASRAHLANLPLIVEATLGAAGLPFGEISAIAVTRGPGLLGCLLAGVHFARGLAFASGRPLIGINHIEGHLLAPQLDNPRLKFPYLALVVSGGHTEMQIVHDFAHYELVARTTDDAAGEAFDKSARLLGLEYPGGAALARLADAAGESSFMLPRVMRHRESFSFSGLKTAAALLIERNRERLADSRVRGELAYAIQEAIVDALVTKVEGAISNTGLTRVAVTGGVSANQALRRRVSAIAGVESFFPSALHCTDNAAMIAYVGALRFQTGERLANESPVLSRWPVESLSQLADGSGRLASI